MSGLSRYCQYAVRAVFELSRRGNKEPLPLSEIARAQAIPLKFLEQVFTTLRQAGLVEGTRGSRGGYLLSRDPGQLTVGEVIMAVEGPLKTVTCLHPRSGRRCPLRGACPFEDLWEEASAAVDKVFNGATFAGLVGRKPQGYLKPTTRRKK
jgi:Rrf2 family protein